MDNKDLKLFYDIQKKDTKLKFTVTCEEGKDYEPTDKIPKIKLPPQSNNTHYQTLLKFAAIVLFIEPFYKYY